MSRFQSTCEPNAPTDPRILRPCRFCGETEHLHLDEGAFERVAVRDGRVVMPIFLGIHPTNMECVDSISCQVCDTIAALDVWNGTRPASDFAAIRNDEVEDEPQAVAA